MEAGADTPQGDAAESRVALVTGGSRGIGNAIAEALLAAGYRLAITARKPEPLAEAAARLGDDSTVLAVSGNSGDPEHRAAAVAAVIERFGRLDLLVNNTGINPMTGPLVEMDLGAVTKMLDTNVVGTLGWVKEAHRQWMGEQGGVILNLASIAGLTPFHASGAYGMSKAAVIHMTRQLAAELAPKIRVNALAPAVVKTRFAASIYDGREAAVAERYPMKRLGLPEDVASAAVFLASDAAGWITGETLVIDGGILSVPQHDD